MAVRLLEKINTYYGITTVGEAEIPMISLGWFGEELRDLFYVLVTRYLLTEDNTDYFQPLYDAKVSMLEDKDYFRRIKLKQLIINSYNLYYLLLHMNLLQVYYIPNKMSYNYH